MGRRWRRIYPIFLLALLFSGYNAVVLSKQPFPLRDFFGNLFMLQDSGLKPGCWFPTFGGDAPLWSLAYEWWFYVLFYPIWRFIPIKRQRLVAVGISFGGLAGYACFPNQPCLYLAYFIVWWTGVEFARQYVAIGHVSFQSQWISFVTLAMFTGLAIVLLSCSAHHYYHWSPWAVETRNHLDFRAYPILQMRQFGAGLLIGAGALIWQAQYWKGFNMIFGVFKYFAPISYGIYALHYIFITGSFFLFLPAQVRPWVAVMASLAAAWFAEIPFQQLANRLTSFFSSQTVRH